ncbi:MAG TPA: hypothetical protein PK359_14330 [Burkholderiaceae bacterium]|jgi:hypothetical protein|nr:hypothetical protein [Burkholderiaceae bacterium]
MPTPVPLQTFAWIATHPWLYPVLEAVHIVGIALLLGSLFLVELRVWGFGATLPLPELARFGLTLSATGFAVAAFSGLVMASSQAAELIGNRAFLLKMLLLSAAGGNALWFHGRGSLRLADGLARLQTLISTALWLAVVLCGRWIAYA